MKTRLPEALDDCLARLHAGETLEASLARYPSQREQLERLLNTALSVSSAPRVTASAEFRQASRSRLIARMRERTMKTNSVVERTAESSWVADAWGRLVGVLSYKRFAVPIALVLLTALVGSFFLSGVFRSTPAPSGLLSNCTLSILGGSAEIQAEGSSSWASGVDGMTLGAGSRIKTASDSQVVLTFFEGSTLRVAPESEIEIRQVEGAAGKPTVITLKQWAGRTWSRVVHMADPGSRYEIETPSAYAMVRGTAFMTDVDEKGSTMLQVTNGTVAVGAQGQQVSVRVGYEVRVELGSTPSEPVPTTNEISPPALAGGVAPEPAATTAPTPARTSTIPAPTPTSSPSPTPTPLPTPTPAPDPTPAPTPPPSAGGSGGSSGSPSTYLLIVQATVGGSVAPASSASYANGTVVAILASPDPGYAFVNWTGTTSGIADVNAASTTITMTGNKTITANFAAARYALTIASTIGGNVTQPGVGTFSYSPGTVVNLLAVLNPSLGTQFQKWEGDVTTIGDVNAASTNITMNGNYVINAKFQTVPVATLTIATSANGTVAQPGIGTFSYNQGTTVTLLAVPDPGSGFVNWTGTTGGIADVNAASTTITMTGNKTITANFAAARYTLTITSTTGGNVTQPGVGTFSYSPGTVVNLLAVLNPSLGTQFQKWEGDVTTIGDVNAASTNITMDGNYVINAKFHGVSVHTLTVTTSGNGTVLQPGIGTFSCNHGTVVTLLAVPDPSFVFMNWTGDGGIADVNAASTTIVMSGNKTIVANFGP
jgi:DUF971 family protein